MGNSSVSVVRESDQAKVLDTLVSAFMDDPVERWLYPDIEEYLAHFPLFLAAFGSRAFTAQTVWSLGEFLAVALWMPPGTEPDGDLVTSLLTESVSPQRHEDAFAVLEQMEIAHPKYPHWYLPWLGVHAAYQGTGLGAQLIKYCLGIVDASHLSAYLESSNPRNISFYRRHGFEVTGEAQAGACPPVTFMLRAPR